MHHRITVLLSSIFFVQLLKHTSTAKNFLFVSRYKSGVRSVRGGGGGGGGGAEEARRSGLKALPKRARTRCRGMNMGQKLSGGVKSVSRECTAPFKVRTGRNQLLPEPKYQNNSRRLLPN